MPKPSRAEANIPTHGFKGSKSEDYYDGVDIMDYDETITAHPYMDQIKAAIVDRVVLERERKGGLLKVLDVGTGSGQLARTLCGVTGLTITLLDRDPHSRAFCAEHPELNDLDFVFADVTSSGFDAAAIGGFDVACALGVLHHVPPPVRALFLSRLGELASTVLIADEGILEYASEAERRANAKVWYSFVIGEAERRGLKKLAKLESGFMASDTSAVRGPTDDFKQSPDEIVLAAQGAGLTLEAVTRLGPWSLNKGGLYLAAFEHEGVKLR